MEGKILNVVTRLDLSSRLFSKSNKLDLPIRYLQLAKINSGIKASGRRALTHLN